MFLAQLPTLMCGVTKEKQFYLYNSFFLCNVHNPHCTNLGMLTSTLMKDNVLKRYAVFHWYAGHTTKTLRLSPIVCVLDLGPVLRANVPGAKGEKTKRIRTAFIFPYGLHSLNYRVERLYLVHSSASIYRTQQLVAHIQARVCVLDFGT